MKYLFLTVLLTSCAHNSGPEVIHACPVMQWVDKGVNRPLDRIDRFTLESAKKHCGAKTNGNVCVIYIERRPNHDYYAHCGRKRIYEVK